MVKADRLERMTGPGEGILDDPVAFGEKRRYDNRLPAA
jgi:hypothetical protein